MLLAVMETSNTSIGQIVGEQEVSYGNVQTILSNNKLQDFFDKTTVTHAPTMFWGGIIENYVIRSCF